MSRSLFGKKFSTETLPTEPGYTLPTQSGTTPYGTGTNGATGPLPSSHSNPDIEGLLFCLSCHDGNYAQGAMMKNKVFETLPGTYGTYNTIPTLLDNVATSESLSQHPVGTGAVISCPGPTGPYGGGWDCTITAGVISMNGTGTYAQKFFDNYGFFVSPAVYSNNPVVMCTTCHNQHVMNEVVLSPANTGSGLSGFYQTMFFLRGPYNPNDQVAGSNQTAQFCRQCHGGNSNELNGSTAGTTY